VGSVYAAEGGVFHLMAQETIHVMSSCGEMQYAKRIRAGTADDTLARHEDICERVDLGDRQASGLLTA
jgi:hypothetical protein